MAAVCAQRGRCWFLSLPVILNVGFTNPRVPNCWLTLGRKRAQALHKQAAKEVLHTLLVHIIIDSSFSLMRFCMWRVMHHAIY